MRGEWESGGEGADKATGCVPGLLRGCFFCCCYFLSHTEREMATARFYLDHAWHVGQAVDLPSFLAG